MVAWSLVLWMAAADPEVTRALANVATSQGEARAIAVQGYVASCRGGNRFAFKNNKNALQALRPTFRDEDPKVRMAALGLSACYGPGTFGGELVYLVEDKHDEVRERAYEEAAHDGTRDVMLALAAQVEQCAAKLPEMGEVDVKWCKFALYGLGEGGRATRDLTARKRVADLSAPFTTSPAPGLREHALRNLGLCGNAVHVPVLDAMQHSAVATEAEKKQARGLVKTLKKRK